MVEETIDPFCGRIKLRTGCLIFAYFRLVVEITLGSYMAVMKIPSWVQGVSTGFHYYWIRVGVVIMLLFMALSIVACIVLLVGLHKKRREYVAGYDGHAKGCIFVTLTFCAGRFIRPTSPQDFTLFRIGFILLLLQVFFLLVIRCYCDYCCGAGACACACACAFVRTSASPLQRC